MKIAYVYDAVYPWEKGGAQKRVWEIARRLADDHDVHLYGMHYWDGPSVVHREGVTLHGVCEPHELYVDGRRSIPQALRFAGAVTPHLLRESFDVIDCQEFPYFPCFAGKAHELLRDSSLVVTWYEVWDDYWYDYIGRKGLAGKLVERATVRLADTVVPISAAIADDLAGIGRTDGVEVVPNGVDFHGLQEIPPGETDWDVSYVGRLSEHKRVDALLDATATVQERLGRDVRVGVVGDGPEREALEAHAERIGVADSVTFLGFVEADEDVIGHLKASDVFVLPSIREGFPNTILEAAACGVPSIVTNHPENGGRAVVEDGVSGFVTDPAADALAERMIDVLDDPDRRATLQAGARDFGRRHDWSAIVERVAAVYDAALADGERRADPAVAASGPPTG